MCKYVRKYIYYVCMYVLYVDSLSNKFSPNMSQEEYNEAMKNANPEDVKNAMKAMDNMLDSNVFDEVLYVLLNVCIYVVYVCMY